MIDLVDLQGELGRKGGGAAGAERRNVDHFCLRIEPFDEAALIAHLQTFGLTAAKAESRFGAEGKGLSLYCFDPDGNQVELKGPSEA
jgi:extradiol dioxygenase family protein